MTPPVLSRFLWESTLTFWFDELKPKHWFVSSTELDKTISDRFSDALCALSTANAHDEVSTGNLGALQIHTPLEALAAILVTDQFSRNIHRGKPQAFATDSFALSLSNHLIDTDQLPRMSTAQIQFAVMPQMHAENIDAQQRCVALYQRYGVEHGLQSAIEHLEIIEQFGRFPHRNRVLDRLSTPEEIEYLKDGKSFGQA